MLPWVYYRTGVVLQWTSMFTRKLARSSLGRDMYASSEMVSHMALLKEFHSPLVDIPPGMAGMEGCDSLFTDVKNEKCSQRSIWFGAFLVFGGTSSWGISRMLNASPRWRAPRTE